LEPLNSKVSNNLDINNNRINSYNHLSFNSSPKDFKIILTNKVKTFLVEVKLKETLNKTKEAAQLLKIPEIHQIKNNAF
jgi:hypothetical protein